MSFVFLKLQEMAAPALQAALSMGRQRGVGLLNIGPSTMRGFYTTMTGEEWQYAAADPLGWNNGFMRKVGSDTWIPIPEAAKPVFQSVAERCGC